MGALLQARPGGLTSDIFIGLNLNWPLWLAAGIRIAPRCCRWQNGSPSPGPSPSRTTPIELSQQTPSAQEKTHVYARTSALRSQARQLPAQLHRRQARHAPRALLG